MKVSIAQLRAIGLSDTEILNLIETSQSEGEAHIREQNRIRKQNQRARHAGHSDQRDHRDKVSPSSPPPSMVSPITPSLTTPSPSPPSKYPSLRSDNWPSDYREKFWQAYPRKTGKGAAIRKLEGICRSGEIGFAELLAAISLIDASEPKFIPHPLTWLNQGRYFDAPPSTAGPRRPFQPTDPTAPTAEELRRKYAERGKAEGVAAETAAILARGISVRSEQTNRVGMDRAGNGAIRQLGEVFRLEGLATLRTTADRQENYFRNDDADGVA